MAKYDIVIKGGTVIDGPGDQHDRPRPGAPFVEDSVDDLARYLPVERILFGSDWPHGRRSPSAEGFPGQNQVVSRRCSATDHGR